MLNPVVLPIGRRKICTCPVRCRLRVDFCETDGSPEYSICIKQARDFAYGILDSMLAYAMFPATEREKVHWPEADKAIALDMEGKGFSQAQIGLKLGRTPKAVRNQLARMRG